MGRLAWKLIVTTSVLLAAAVASAALFSDQTIIGLAEREAASRRRAGEESMQHMSALMARHVAVSAALPLAEGNFTYLDSLVAATVREDPRLTWMLIADAGSNRVVARTPGAPPGDTLADALSPAVLAAPADRALSARDPDDPSKFTFGIKISVGERLVGQLRLGVSTAELEADLAADIAAARADATAARRELLVVAALILLLGILLAGVQGVRVARPLRALSRGAHRIAEGDTHERVEVRGRDEIAQLAADFNFMADKLGSLLAETASKASLEKEMSLARSVQEAMNPTRQVIELGPLRVAGTCEPAHDCGGDWWTLRRLSGDRLLLVVGDVTGHGIPSAMIAATARGAVEALAAVDERLLTPEQVLRAIDRAIRGVGTQNLLMTCFAALLDPRHGVVEFSNAGHNFPYLLNTQPSGEVADIAVLALRGSPLGNIPGDFVLSSGRRRLAPGDVLVFFTDGVIDRVDGGGNRFGDRRLRQLITSRRYGDGGPGLGALRDDILGALARFGSGVPADDDITLVLCEYRPRAVSVSRARGATA